MKDIGSGLVTSDRIEPPDTPTKKILETVDFAQVNVEMPNNPLRLVIARNQLTFNVEQDSLSCRVGKATQVFLLHELSTTDLSSN